MHDRAYRFAPDDFCPNRGEGIETIPPGWLIREGRPSLVGERPAEWAKPAVTWFVNGIMNMSYFDVFWMVNRDVFLYRLG